MPKIIAHVLSGATIIVVVFPKANLTKWSLVIGSLLAISPDFDLVIEWLLNIPDIHRGFTHSLFVSFIVGVVLCFLMDVAHQRIALAYGLAYLSHSLLDMATSTTGGVKLFWPFLNDFYHLGITKILELPFGPAPKEIVAWVLIETVIFLPIFLIVLYIRRSIN